MVDQHNKLEELRNYTENINSNKYRAYNNIQRATAIRKACDYSLAKPQLKFEDKVDNSPAIWKPRLAEKPNAMEPLNLQIIIVDKKEKYCHPYEVELKHFKPLERQMVAIESPSFKSLRETKFVYIDRKTDLDNMLVDLRSQKEIAIDLEHHSERSYQGFTCLMQISTRDTDYVVDTIALRSELTVLNHVFTNPNILKIFHGGISDITWLQKDFSVYVVNMFDTCIAAQVLNIKFPNLGNLKEFFCKVDSDKNFQLTDWRVRPISQELLNYAREDTHYLIYIKDELTNLLLSESTEKENLLEKVYNESTAICLRTYEKPYVKENTYQNIAKNYRLKFNGRSLRALKELVEWRDKKARELDESVGHVLKNTQIIKLCGEMPKTEAKIFRICSYEPIIIDHVEEILSIIDMAKKFPLIEKVEPKESSQKKNDQKENNNTSIEKIFLDRPSKFVEFKSLVRPIGFIDLREMSHSSPARGLESPGSNKLKQFERRIIGTRDYNEKSLEKSKPLIMPPNFANTSEWPSPRGKKGYRLSRSSGLKESSRKIPGTKECEISSRKELKLSGQAVQRQEKIFINSSMADLQFHNTAINTDFKAVVQPGIINECTSCPVIETELKSLVECDIINEKEDHKRKKKNNRKKRGKRGNDNTPQIHHENQLQPEIKSN